jgi:hypothetical protein
VPLFFPTPPLPHIEDTNTTPTLSLSGPAVNAAEFDFSLQTFQGVSVIPISFPDVIGTLTPTVGTTFVHAIPTFRIAKITTLTHKTFANIIDAELDFCLPVCGVLLNIADAVSIWWKRDLNPQSGGDVTRISPFF